MVLQCPNLKQIWIIYPKPSQLHETVQQKCYFKISYGTTFDYYNPEAILQWSDTYIRKILLSNSHFFILKAGSRYFDREKWVVDKSGPFPKRKSIFCNITVSAAKPPKNANFYLGNWLLPQNQTYLGQKLMNLHEIKNILTWTLLSVFLTLFNTIKWKLQEQQPKCLKKFHFEG